MRRLFLEIAVKSKLSDIDLWLFFGFLLTLPLSVRKIIWYVPLEGSFNEYADISVYLSDIFLLGAVVATFIIKRHNTSLLSIVWKCFTWNSKSIPLEKCLIITLPFILILWSIVSLSYAVETIIGIFFVCKLIELYALYLFIIFRIVPRETILKKQATSILKIIGSIFIFTGVIESVIAIGQFLQQRSLGLTFIKESVIDPIIPGVAKIIVDNERYIRAYGTFPHPNVLGGFLLVSIMMSHYYFKMFHVEQIKTRLLVWGLIGIQYIGILLTFSKSAIVGLGVALIYSTFVSRGTNSRTQKSKETSHSFKNRMFHVEQLIIWIVLAGVVLVVSNFTWYQINTETLLFQSLKERALYQSIALDIINKHPILGISCGQLVIFMSQQPIYPLFSWQLQPVHNVFLLIWSELGYVGFFLFTSWYVLLIGCRLRIEVEKVIHNVGQVIWLQQKTWALFEVYTHAIMFGFLPILLFDHYMWDIQQGQLLLWVVSGAFSGCVLQHIYSKNASF